MKTETKSTVLVKHHLRKLKLPTMYAECEKTAARAAKDNLDHLAYLLTLCGLERRQMNPEKVQTTPCAPTDRGHCGRRVNCE